MNTDINEDFQMQQCVHELIDEFHKSIIQSEAEVRSKFMVPLLNALGYPSELRAEEFNVYGYAGCEELRAKPADFILFKDKEFGKHRTKTQKNKIWVEENSLLVVETKNIDNMPKDFGQAKFYTAWTKAVAYIVSDGQKFCAYYYNPINSDYEIVDTEVNHLYDSDVIYKIIALRYCNILSIKESGTYTQPRCNLLNDALITNDENEHVIDEYESIELPEKTKQYLKSALGKNVEGLTEIQILKKFLIMTDTYLECDMRYDIPEYMMGIPRKEYKAEIYLNDEFGIFDRGIVTVYYRNETDIFEFTGQYIIVFAVYKNNELFDYYINYHVLDAQVSERLRKLRFVRRALFSTKLCIFNIDAEDIWKRLIIQIENSDSMWISKKYEREQIDFWISGMERLKTIEDYYEVKFSLKQLVDSDEIIRTYKNIEYVYNGIVKENNCMVIRPVDKKPPRGKFEITEPIILEKDNENIPLEELTIHGKTFKPVTSMILPGMINWRKKLHKNYLVIPVCCECKIVDK